MITSLLSLLTECKMVIEKPRHSQSQGSVEQLNRYVENIIAVWKRDNNRSAGPPITIKNDISMS